MQSEDIQDNPYRRILVKKMAFLFPGQGSQRIGMGLEFYQAFDTVREVFDMAEEIVKINLSKLCFKGPMDELTATINLQPALTAINLSTLMILQKEGAKAHITAGHSLGEYSALCAAAVISPEDTFRSVMKRGQLMHREATQQEGAMSAIIGLTIEAVKDIVSQAESDGIVSVANHNTKEQIVITGEPKAVQKAASLAINQNGRSIPLKVSGAWHSALIHGAENDFKQFLENILFSTPDIPVLHNVTADSTDDPHEIRSMMVTQLCHPVRWYDTMKKMMDEEIEIFVEVGPGNVLSGLLKKTIPPDYPHQIFRVGSMKTLDAFFSAVL
jgi:[acyl-carrier-protein] S-malonyltransferase